MRTITLCCLIFSVAFARADDWVAPENAQPSDILQQAKADQRNGDYADALAKHLWYHDNATRIQPAQSGVRLSFALGSWLELAEVYPPALVKLKEVRNATEAKIRDESKIRVRFEDFHDFVALNRTLRQEKKTSDTFVWLHETDPEDAARMFGVARPALIKQKQFELCGEYMDADRDWKRIRDSYTSAQKSVPRFGKSYEEFTEKKFVNDVSTLVAIKMKAGEKEDAQMVAAKATQFVKGKMHNRLRKALEPALDGEVPKPWP